MKMDRIKRYKDKIGKASKRADQINQWALETSHEDFLVDEKTKLATYKAFQEMVEACLDIVAMICKDTNNVPSDDYTNIQNLEWLGKEIKAALSEANGLRNRLVHRYNQTDDTIALESMKALLPELRGFLEDVEIWIGKRL
jgi:uncharacterized protein YutE (UPF0331/DUF86 family)